MKTKQEAKALETKCVWNKQIKRWVCKYCGNEPETFYVVTGHDHTDDSIWCCECRRNHEHQRTRGTGESGSWMVKLQ